MSFIDYRTFLSFIPVSFIVVVFVPLSLHGFNIDTKNMRVINGPKGSLFGYTAQFLPFDRAANTIGMLIGAPKADTGKDVHEDGPKAGALKVCRNVFDSSDSCSENLYLDDQIVMVDGSLDERFGSALAITDSSTLMVCSPGWKDTRTANSSYITFMLGRCSVYTFNIETRGSELKPFYRFDHKDYLTSLSGTSEYYLGLGTYGFSADSDRKTVFVTGGPGVLQSEGSVSLFDFSTRQSVRTSSVLVNKLDSTAYGYLGYSVKVGKFCDGDDICLAAGAPNRNRIGQVILYKWENKANLVEQQLLDGEVAWSFFGSALGVADVDKDGYDELLVGAPHYTDVRDALQGHDQGHVYVFSRKLDQTRLEMVRKVTLDGTKQKYARFGTAVQNIGDINLDGFADIAVGAPGEDDEAGAVYVYLGGPAGLVNSPSQRISASQVPSTPSPIKGLGYSFSDYTVPQNEQYPRFAATSVVSDAVVLFKCRPVVDVKATLEANPNPVDTELLCDDVKRPCFNIKFCMEFDLRGESRRPLNFQIRLDIDVQIRSSTSKRALFRMDDGQLVESISMDTEKILARGTCKSFQAVLRENQVNQDRFTPVEIVATYSLAPAQSQDIDPVLDAVKPNNVSEIITFLNKCEDDNICKVDLSMSGKVGYTQTGSWDSIVVNDTKELLIDVTVKNSGETSYWTVIKVDVDSPIPFSRFKSDLPVSCQSAGPAAADSSDASDALATTANLDKTTVVCNYYKPLDEGASLSLLVAFDTERMPLNKNKVMIKAQAMPKNKDNNPELTPDDNTVTLKSEVQIIADVVLESSSSPAEVTVYEAKKISLAGSGTTDVTLSDNNGNPMNVTHKILVRNAGPSFLPRTTVNISVPMFLRDGTQLTHEADVKISTRDGRVSKCRETVIFDYLVGTTSTTISTTQSTSEKSSSTTKPPSGSTDSSESTSPSTASTLPPFRPPVNRRKRAADDEEDDAGKVQDTIYAPTCGPGHMICQVFVCDIGTTLPNRIHAEINVSLVIDKSNIPIPQDFDTFYLLTATEVSEPDHPLFKRWDHPETVQTATTFHLVESGGRINIWIIIGSIIAGLVLITIIIIVLWKLGFFKRDKHHQVERWKRESQRRSRKGYSKAPEGEGGDEGGGADI